MRRAPGFAESACMRSGQLAAPPAKTPPSPDRIDHCVAKRPVPKRAVQYARVPVRRFHSGHDRIRETSFRLDGFRPPGRGYWKQIIFGIAFGVVDLNDHNVGFSASDRDHVQYIQVLNGSIFGPVPAACEQEFRQQSCERRNSPILGETCPGLDAYLWDFEFAALDLARLLDAALGSERKPVKSMPGQSD